MCSPKRVPSSQPPCALPTQHKDKHMLSVKNLRNGLLITLIAEAIDFNSLHASPGKQLDVLRTYDYSCVNISPNSLVITTKSP